MVSTFTYCFEKLPPSPKHQEVFHLLNRYSSPKHTIHVHLSSLLLIDVCENNVLLSAESRRNMWGTHEFRNLELKGFCDIN